MRSILSGGAPPVQRSAAADLQTSRSSANVSLQLKLELAGSRTRPPTISRSPPTPPLPAGGAPLPVNVPDSARYNAAFPSIGPPPMTFFLFCRQSPSWRTRHLCYAAPSQGEFLSPPLTPDPSGVRSSGLDPGRRSSLQPNTHRHPNPPTHPPEPPSAAVETFALIDPL